MKKLFFILLFLISCNSFSQKENYKYVDENFNSISFIKFKKKIDSQLFDFTISNLDTIIYKKLRYKEFYGNLKTKNAQLKKLFLKRNQIDTTKAWLIHVLDTLPDIKDMPKISGIELLDSLNKPTGIFISSKDFKKNFKKYFSKNHKHVLNAQDYIKRIEDEKSKIGDNSELIHLYNYNKGIPLDVLKRNNYFNDENFLIKKIFSDGIIKYQTIIIHPNGEFYVSMFGQFDKEMKLLNKNKFDKHKKSWFKKILKLD
ncbi:hypothetical protein [Lutibacter sp. B1]|uniref:hypothetical protein n=1 Tax=Lutibacter sp. B1 TaxID=2725996 RepID=UPI0014568D35|nr:hypothetical protein [Lutibacter sp. B1]NLP56592.1 hypothetical protein [Lutibacter sp. B1]